MSLSTRIVVLVSAISAATSCTQLCVRKVQGPDSSVPGIRYSLPKPFLRITPQPDGTVKADVVYLADEENTYAIDASTALAAHSLEIELADGLLKKIAWKPDASGPGEQLVKTSGEIYSKIMEERIKQAEAARSAAEEDAEQLEAARKAATEACLQQEVADQRLRILEQSGSNASPEQKLEARLAAAEARARCDAAKRALERLRRGSRSDGGGSSGDAHSDGTGSDGTGGGGTGSGGTGSGGTYGGDKAVDAGKQPDVGSDPTLQSRSSVGGEKPCLGDAWGAVLYAINESWERTCDGGRKRVLTLKAVGLDEHGKQPSYKTRVPP